MYPRLFSFRCPTKISLEFTVRTNMTRSISKLVSKSDQFADLKKETKDKQFPYRFASESRAKAISLLLSNLGPIFPKFLYTESQRSLATQTPNAYCTNLNFKVERNEKWNAWTWILKMFQERPMLFCRSKEFETNENRDTKDREKIHQRRKLERKKRCFSFVPETSRRVAAWKHTSASTKFLSSFDSLRAVRKLIGEILRFR